MKTLFNEKTDFGNWIPMPFMLMLYGTSAVLLLATILLFVMTESLLWPSVACLFFLLALAFTVHMQLCRYAFSFKGGGVMGRIHEYLVSKLPWNGEGQLLDIGCGAGALSIRCALRFPQARITGIDYWGAGWNYAQAQCERNATIEGVINRMKFQKGDAAALDFDDETFDAAVSNFVFHEVRTQPEKQKVVREALRVVRKGGSFAFIDLFSRSSLYGDMQAFVNELKAEGISEITYIAHLEFTDLFPKIFRAPWLMPGTGILYGRK